MASRDHEDPVRAAGSLPVACRRTLSGDGHVSRSEHVRCPRREGAIGIGTCLACADCEGLVRGADGDALLCAAASEPEARASSAAADQVGLAEIMTRDVVCVRDDVSAESLAALLVDLGITGAPVVDERGRPVGMVSRSDLVQLQLADAGMEVDVDERLERGFHAASPSRGAVRDFMMPMTFTLPESASIAHAAALMAYESIHRIPVVSTDGSVVGIVSALDVLRWLAVGSGYAVPARRAFDADAAQRR